MNNRQEMLKELYTKDSEFKYVPKEIGDILYCDIERKKSLGCTTLIFAFAFFMFILLSKSVVGSSEYLGGIIFYGGIVLTFLYVLTKLGKSSYSINEYYVGTNGFLIASYVDSGKDLKQQVVNFADVQYLLTKVYNIEGSEDKPSYTEYIYDFVLRNSFDNHIVFTTRISKVRSENDVKDHNADFLKRVEEEWTDRKTKELEELRKETNSPVGLDYVRANGVLKDYVILGEDGLEVNIERLIEKKATSLSLYNWVLTVFFDGFGKIIIQLNSLCDVPVLFAYLNRKYNINVALDFEGEVKFDELNKSFCKE